MAKILEAFIVLLSVTFGVIGMTGGFILDASSTEISLPAQTQLERELGVTMQSLSIVLDRLKVVEKKLKITVDEDHQLTFTKMEK